MFGNNQEKNRNCFDQKIEIGERCQGVHCVDLGESFPTIANSNEYLLAKFGFDTAENEPCKEGKLSNFSNSGILLK